MSGVGRTADDSPFGRARSGGGHRFAGRSRPGVQGCLQDAASAHRHFATLPLRSLDQLSLQAKLRDIGRIEGATAKAVEKN